MVTKTNSKSPQAPEITPEIAAETPETGDTAPETADAAPETFERHPDAKDGTCGFPVELTKDGVVTHKPCLKDPGHANGHSSKNRVKVDENLLTADTLILDAFGADEEIVAAEMVRSVLQVQTDRQVAAVHDAWVKKGRPAGIIACKKAGLLARYWIEPQQADTIRVLLRKAGQFNNVHVKILPVQKHKSGRYMLPWVAVDKRVTTRRSS